MTLSATHPLVQLSSRHLQALKVAERDLFEFSHLHPDFISDCLDAIARKEERVAAPLLGRLFPHLVAEGLRLQTEDRRRLAAAWLALYGYISLVDSELDTKGFLTPRACLSASAVLGWGLTTLTQIAGDTDYSQLVLDNVRRAFAGQYLDVLHRSDSNFDRNVSDADKNRAVIAVVAAYCAAGRPGDMRLLKAAEKLLGPLQTLDDLNDLVEDLNEGNFTTLLKLARSNLPPTTSLEGRAVYYALFDSPQFPDVLALVITRIDEALLLLDGEKDVGLCTYFTFLRGQVDQFSLLLRRYHRGDGVAREDLYDRTQQIFCHS